MAKHIHHWRMTTHLDFCHAYTSVFACTGCSATASKTIERDPNDLSAQIWMFEERYQEVRRDARGRFITPRWEPVVCQRCRELQDGAARRSDLVIVGKDGEVEREEHRELDRAA